MPQTKQFIQYYAQCYQADNRQTGIGNLLKNPLELLHFFQDADLLGDKITELPVPEKISEKWQKQLQLYHNDKKLLGTFWLVRLKDDENIPLFLFPCELLTERGISVLTANLEEAFINPIFEQYLKQQLAPDLVAEFMQRLAKLLPFQPRHVLDLDVLFDKLPTIDQQGLEEFPKMLSKASIARKASPCLLPQFSVGLMRRSLQVRSILQELELLQKTAPYSSPLTLLFADSIKPTRSRKAIDLFSPFTLSKAQEAISRRALSAPFNVVIGPPGTGKSFTIAAIALNAAVNHKSVLITSKTNQAVDVIAQKLERDFAAQAFFFRGGLRSNKKLLKARLQEHIQLIRRQQKQEVHTKGKRYSSLLQDNQKKLRQQKKQLFKMLQQEYHLTQHLLYGSKNLLSKWLAERQIRSLLKSKSVLEQYQYLQILERRQRQLEKEFIHQAFRRKLRRSASYTIAKIQNFVRAFTARTNERRAAFLDKIDIKELLQILPIWLVNLQEIGAVFPLDQEQFDLVIIDEASQVDLASALPVLQRAKHVVIFGDPLQLRHVSFLSLDKEQQIGEQIFGSDAPPMLPAFRDYSLLDFISEKTQAPDCIHYLDEHYRSHPSIIHFSNQEFYGKQLKVMKQYEPQQSKERLQFVHIQGKRKQNGVNEAEAAFILKDVRTALQKGKIPSVGIISPFRDQVDYIRNLLEKEFTLEELAQLDLHVNTPYGFQGDEREVIYLSFTLDDDSPPQALQYLERPGVFNVSITRAQEQQIVLHSFQPSQLSKNSILRKYLEFRHQPLELPDSSTQDEFLQEVLAFLKPFNIEDIRINQKMGDLQVDLGFVKDGQFFAIDLVGFPGKQADFMDLDQYQTLERSNCKTIILPYSSWLVDQARTKHQLTRWLIP